MLIVGIESTWRGATKMFMAMEALDIWDWRMEMSAGKATGWDILTPNQGKLESSAGAYRQIDQER
jgi:hypothetical protein